MTSDSIDKLLAALRGGGPTTTVDLLRRTGMAERTFYHALSRAKGSGLIACDAGVWRCVDAPKVERAAEAAAVVRLYRETSSTGRADVCIETDAADERVFLDECSRSITLRRVLIEGEPAEVAMWLRRLVDVVARLRGYRADVAERRVIRAGALAPSQSALLVGGDEAQP